MKTDHEDIEVLVEQMTHPHDSAIARIEQIDTQCFSVAERSSIAAQLEQPFARVWAAHIRFRAQKDNCQPCWAGHLVAWHVVDEMHILNVATAAEFRRCGVATALVGELVRYAQRSHVRIVLLEVRRSNVAAISLYENFGFELFSVRKNYYEDNGEDALEMMLTVALKFCQ